MVPYRRGRVQKSRRLGVIVRPWIHPLQFGGEVMAPLPATEGTSMAVTRATDPGKAKDVSRLRYVPNMRNKRAEGGYIANVTACLANVLHTLVAG